MAQDIIIRTLCDVCLDSGEERHDASAYTIGDGPVLLDIDLCDVHAKPLAELVAHARPSERGKPPKRKRAPAGPVAPVIESAGAHACDDAGCGRVFASAQGLAMHRYRAHGIRSETPAAEAARARQRARASRQGSA
jgi:hypothetical protein